jgi:addiction module RelE/StbE family toxin
MSKRYTVLYSPEALKDQKEIYTYIAFHLKALMAAANLIDKIRKAIKELSEFPLRYQAVEWEPWASMGMRRLAVNNYVIFYLVDETELKVKIVRIFYGGRDIENSL